MKLTMMHVKNFRSLCDVDIPFQPDLTILIGENDAGKSSVLDLLELVLQAPHVTPSKIPTPEESDYAYDSKARATAEQITAEFTFKVSLDESTSLPEGVIDQSGTYRLRVTYQRDRAPNFEVYQQRFVVDALNMSDSALSRKTIPEIDEILQELELSPGNYPNKTEKVQAIKESRQEADRKWDWASVKASELSFLPRIERYRALDYREPERFMEKTLKSVFQRALRTKRGEERFVVEVKRLQERTEKAIQEEVHRLTKYIQRFLPGVKDVSYKPDIRFEESFRGGELQVDRGRGLHLLSRVGDGTKRRMVMAAMEWEREALRAIGSDMPIIRAYDEPDTNLHYNAQRQFYKTVRGILRENDSQQAIICTHSVFMVDAAPVSSIVHLLLDEHGCTRIERLVSNQPDDEEISRFLQDVAAQMGVTNSVLFFDRSYLLVEGETEYYALPIIYRRLYGRSMSEDGIAIIDLSGHGNRTGLMRLLGKRRATMVVCLLDLDAIDEHKKTMRKNGWSEEHVDNSLFGIGDKEFEDAFSDSVWASALNVAPEWERVDGQPWNATHIAPLREEKKFSDQLTKLIWLESVVQQHERRVSKPLLGEHLARTIDVDEIPDAIIQVFERARQIAGVGK